MDRFSFDTSGFVEAPSAAFPGKMAFWQWSDLSPFAQGFVEGLFADPRLSKSQSEADGRITRVPPSFSDLSPDALALILRDCASFVNIATGLGIKELGSTQGRYFWAGRQNGTLQHAWAAAFPPLRPFLNDEGKIGLEAVQ